MLNDAKHVAKLASEVLKIVITFPARAYAFAITKELRVRHGAGFTHSLDVGKVLRLLKDEGLLEALGPQKGGNGRLRDMYAPTWKAFLFLNQK